MVKDKPSLYSFSVWDQMEVYWDVFLFFYQTVIYSALVLGFSSANKCLLKVAAYAAQLEQYQKAIEIYEQVSCLFNFK